MAVFEPGIDPTLMQSAARLRAAAFGFKDLEVVDSSRFKTLDSEFVLIFVEGDNGRVDELGRHLGDRQDGRLSREAVV